jgi:hypothetical protein
MLLNDGENDYLKVDPTDILDEIGKNNADFTITFAYLETQD